MTLDEEITKLDLIASDAFEGGDANEFKQLAEWLKELKAYREILENADKIIKSEYGCVIIEGYADIIDKMNEVYKRSDSECHIV